MWKLALFSAIILNFTTYTWADNHEKEVRIQDLPHNVQLFIDSHFNTTPATAAYTTDKGGHNITLANGYEIEFDKHDKWCEIENDLHAPLPNSVVALLPPKAIEYIAQKYPDWPVYSIERNHHGYEVKLHGNEAVELNFDHDGKFLHHKHID